MLPLTTSDPNPWRRQVEAKAHIDEAMRLMSGPGWRDSNLIFDLDRASDSLAHVLDGAGYNSWEYARPLAGRHEEVSPWPGRHTRGAGGPEVYRKLRKDKGEGHDYPQ